MSIRPEEDLIERLVAVFGEPRVNDPNAYMAECAKAWSGWSGSILHRAGDELIRTAKFFPRPAEINDIAGRIAADDASRKAASAPPRIEAERQPPTPEQCERTSLLVQQLKRFVAEHTLSDKPAPKVDWTRVQRPAVERMQRESPNRELHTVRRGRLS